ncbi:hypothetical protein [Variovorax sp. PCZ-1]|uniref:hypothetical protein n=1 Tax=Variovorax sp. PCZ-1 TaxID=2835533 RepID=UPI001BCC12E7|nr:hypothetical protein [Variovorax sp. PCZ-1]MBS7806153.1 hypothetical protein [Variovorax sp. PCZ-1]
MSEYDLSKKSETSLTLTDIPEGSWQINWYGRLVKVPQAHKTAFIMAYLREVHIDAEGNISRWGDRTINRPIPITNLPALPPATVINRLGIIRGQPLNNKAKLDDVVLNFNRLGCWLVPRSVFAQKDVKLPRSMASKVSADAEYEGYLLVVPSEKPGDLPHVFTCATIFQFFWAVSSKWAQMMVNGRFLDLDRYVFSHHRSFLSGDKKMALIWLRQWMDDDDARFIATIAFSDYAQEAGMDIFRHLAVSPENEQRCLRALPPYEGAIPMAVLRQKIKANNNQAYWFVHSIESCSYKHPTLESVKFDRDNDGRIEDLLSAIEEKLPMDRSPSHVTEYDDAPEEETPTQLSDDPHKLESALSIRLQLPERLPFLNHILADKLPQTETKYRNEASILKRDEAWQGLVSTLVDGSSAANLAPQGYLTSLREHEKNLEEAAESIMGDVFALTQKLLLLSNTELKIKGKQYRLETAAVIGGKPSRQAPFFLIPPATDGKRWAWRYRDREKRFLKRAVCLRVSLTDSSTGHTVVRYILDIEEREGQNQNKMLLVWSDDDQAFSREEAQVRHIIDAIAHARTTSLPEPKVGGLNHRARKHPHGDLRTFWQDMLEPGNR